MSEVQRWARPVDGGWVEITGAFTIPGGGSNEVWVNPDDPAAGKMVVTYDLPFSEEWILCATPADRNRYGIKAILPPDEPLPGHTILSETLVTHAGKPKAQWVTAERPLDDRRAQAKRVLGLVYADRLAIGFPHTFGDQEETLQCRNEHDRTNWLGLIKKCEVAIALGAAEAPVSPPIRCTSNRSYAIPHEEAYQLMLALLNWAGEMMAAFWAHSDAIGAAATAEDIGALDFSGGWPEA